MNDFIASLDSALAGLGETFTLRRIVGTGKNVTNIDVDCVGRIDWVKIRSTSSGEIVEGVVTTTLNVIFSPTQINDARWPGGTVPVPPPFNVDPRVPRAGGQDKAIIRGVQRQIDFVDTFWPGGELSRIEIRVLG